MDLIFEIIDGDQQGSRSPVRDGTTLGRQGCDVTISDSKVSSKHARVEKRADGELWLVDLGSSNKIRFGGKKVRELKLTHGIVFGLGRITLKTVAADHFMESTQPEIVVETATRTWWNTIRELAARARSESRAVRREIEVFPKLVRLKIQRGVQAGTEWTLGYGPRDIGAESIDLPLFENGLPGQCFRLIPKDDSVYLKVADAAKGRVSVNGRVADRIFIENGDEISIGDTQIKVILESGGTRGR